MNGSKSEAFLSAQPKAGIEDLRPVAELKLHDGGGSEVSENLTGGNLLAGLNADGGNVAVNGDKTAMTHHDNVRGAGVENLAHLAVEDTAGLGAWLTLEVDALTGDVDATGAVDDVVAKAAYHLIGSGDGHGQAALVAGKAAREVGVGVSGDIALRWGNGCSGGSGAGIDEGAYVKAFKRRRRISSEV